MFWPHFIPFFCLPVFPEYYSELSGSSCKSSFFQSCLLRVAFIFYFRFTRPDHLCSEFCVHLRYCIYLHDFFSCNSKSERGKMFWKFSQWEWQEQVQGIGVKTAVFTCVFYCVDVLSYLIGALTHLPSTTKLVQWNKGEEIMLRETNSYLLQIRMKTYSSKYSIICRHPGSCQYIVRHPDDIIAIWHFIFLNFLFNISKSVFIHMKFWRKKCSICYWFIKFNKIYLDSAGSVFKTRSYCIPHSDTQKTEHH